METTVVQRGDGYRAIARLDHRLPAISAEPRPAPDRRGFGRRIVQRIDAVRPLQSHAGFIEPVSISAPQYGEPAVARRGGDAPHVVLKNIQRAARRAVPGVQPIHRPAEAPRNGERVVVDGADILRAFARNVRRDAQYAIAVHVHIDVALADDPQPFVDNFRPPDRLVEGDRQRVRIQFTQLAAHETHGTVFFAAPNEQEPAGEACLSIDAVQFRGGTHIGA